MGFIVFLFLGLFLGTLITQYKYRNYVPFNKTYIRKENHNYNSYGFLVEYRLVKDNKFSEWSPLIPIELFFDKREAEEHLEIVSRKNRIEGVKLEWRISAIYIEEIFE